jgi:misacylated tRNA(Ala) deacylase
LRLEARVVDARPGAVVLDSSPFHPGGGGQLPDRGRLTWSAGEATITGFEVADGRLWHLLASATEPAGVVEAIVDPEFRRMQTELHTGAHVLNALVYRHFDGALITGAQLNDDGTARVDFDLPGADNDRLRALEPEINDVIRQDLPLRYAWVPMDAARAETGLLRSRSVAPPPSADGTVRIVEIIGLDRQACGGTHLSNTAQSAPFRITKVESKGKRNRRIRFALEP